MKEKEYNYIYSSFKIIVRNGKGIARLNKDVCFDVNGKSHDEMKKTLEFDVRNYHMKRWEPISIRGVEFLTLFGLSQIESAFAKRLSHELLLYTNKWDQEARVRFGITGIISEGRSGKPNYQIESFDGVNKQTFYFNGELFNRDEFDISNITIPFSYCDIENVWCLNQ